MSDTVNIAILQPASHPTLAPVSGGVCRPTSEAASSRKYSRSSAPLHLDTSTASWLCTPIARQHEARSSLQSGL
jgi:hypothetical protein